MINAHARLILIPIIFISASISSLSQQNGPAPGSRTADEVNLNDWKEFSSTDGGFKVLFPKTPKESTREVKVGDLPVVTHAYSVQDKATYSVLYFDVPHKVDDPKITGELLVGIRNFVLAELKGRLLNDRPISLDNNPGRLLEISTAKGGIARAMIVVAGQRLYRVLAVPEKRAASDGGDSAKAVLIKYLESFKLTPVDRSAEGEVDRYLRGDPELVQSRIKPPGDLVSGGLLNGKALSLSKPEYPPIARASHASGTVVVRVIIDEEGKVIAAQADSGHPLLRGAAVEAARQARFSPSLLKGKPVRVYGMITYNFVAL